MLQSAKVKLLADNFYGIGSLVEQFEEYNAQKLSGSLSQEEYDERASKVLLAIEASQNVVKVQLADFGMTVVE